MCTPKVSHPFSTNPRVGSWSSCCDKTTPSPTSKAPLQTHRFFFGISLWKPQRVQKQKTSCTLLVLFMIVDQRESQSGCDGVVATGNYVGAEYVNFLRRFTSLWDQFQSPGSCTSTLRLPISRSKEACHFTSFIVICSDSTLALPIHFLQMTQLPLQESVWSESKKGRQRYRDGQRFSIGCSESFTFWMNDKDGHYNGKEVSTNVACISIGDFAGWPDC